MDGWNRLWSGRDQLLMGSVLPQAIMVEHGNMITETCTGKPVRDIQRRPPLHQTVKILIDLRIRENVWLWWASTVRARVPW